MQSQLSAKPDDDPCDHVALAPNVAPVALSEEELTSVLHMAARYRLDRHVTMAPEVTVAPTVEPAGELVRPVLPKDMPVSGDRAADHIAPPFDAMVRPVPANDVGHQDVRRRKGGPIGRALLALLSTLIIGLGAATWKSYGDVASRVVAGFLTQPVVASPPPSELEKSQSEKAETAAPPTATAVQAQAATAKSEQSAAAAQPAQAASAPAVQAVSDSTEQLKSMANDLATLRQQVEDLKTDMAQVKANQVSHSAAKTPAPTQRTKTAALPPRPIAAPPRRPAPPAQPYAPPQAAATQPAVPQIATAPYRSAPQAAAMPSPTSAPPYYPPQRYAPPPPEPTPQATAEPVDQEYWAPRPPMPVR
jgi:hypothetical protein